MTRYERNVRFDRMPHDLHTEHCKNRRNNTLYSFKRVNDDTAQTDSCTADTTKVEHTDHSRYYTTLCVLVFTLGMSRLKLGLLPMNVL
jgi:hypothetical protein